MACCMALESGDWCSDQKIVHTDDEGKAYCVFHAPRGEKGVTLEEFNELVFKRIEDFNTIPEDEREGKYLDLSGTVFEGDIWFDHMELTHMLFNYATFSGVARFDSATFSGKANFYSATFSEYASFHSVTFSKDASFDSATFSGEASFHSATFSKEAHFDFATFSDSAFFDSATFSGDASFRSATFSGDAYFLDATFSGEASFHSATFSGVASFDSATFSGEARFDDATFSGEANFYAATFSGIARFDAATFSGKAYFHSATFSGIASFHSVTFSGEARFYSATFSGEARFYSATFSGEANFYSAKFSGIASFSYATFSGKASFDSATFSGIADFTSTRFTGLTEFNGTAFEGDARFKGALFHEAFFTDFIPSEYGMDFESLRIKDRVVFQNIRLGRALFLRSDLRRCEFVGCEWHEEKGRYILRDEEELRSPKSMSVEEIKAVERLYRAQKEMSRKNSNEYAASHWHVSEKEMLRLRTKFGEKPLLWLTINAYNLLSGYGEDFGKALRALAAVALTAIVLMGLVGFDKAGDVGGTLPDVRYRIYPLTEVNDYNPFPHVYVKWQECGNIAVTTLEHLTFFKGVELKPHGVLGRLMMVLFRILMPIQAALFALALRNRMRR